jgi:hypothetical protein
VKAPFVYFGGKRPIAQEVWARFGDVPNYVEEWSGQLQLCGCLPVRLVALLVVHFMARLASTNEAMRFALKSGSWWA